ncbi:MAG: ATP-binding protein [Chloroflexi bacterium]|nr:ATP-binding protein [Chloroflexota bacterium]
MTTEAATVEQTLAAILADLGSELERTQTELKETELMGGQSRRESETLARRDLQMSNRLRQVEANLEDYSREELREIYNAVRELQMRLFLMRSQVEQLDHKRVTLDRYRQQAQKLMGAIQQLQAITQPPPPPPTHPTETAATPQQTIIRIIDAQEKERQILARQMHDGPASSLSNLVLQAEVVERLYSADPAQARTELSVLKTAVTETFKGTRDFIFNLRPMMLDDLGLFPTLRQFVQDFESKSKITTHLTILGKDRRLPPHIEVILFRAIQELLNNVHRHANASHVQVSIDVADDAVSVTVEDDGSGFDETQILRDAKERKTLGISSLLERSEMLGGEIHFESSLGRGTRVGVKLPIPV